MTTLASASLRPLPEDGYELWLRYRRIECLETLSSYLEAFPQIALCGESATVTAIARELELAWPKLLGCAPHFDAEATGARLVIGTPASCAWVRSQADALGLSTLGREGFSIQRRTDRGTLVFIVAANEDIGLLYGVFHLLEKLALETPLDALEVHTSPRVQHRMLNHWDNLDRTIERGYAGFSLWDWHKLPDHLDPRIVDYARANASIGINGSVLTNVNANAWVLEANYLLKVARIAAAFRPYGIRVYLTARFSAPVELGDLTTADPKDPEVAAWWARKAEEIYRLIPDFGGFLVKANSEGQPGPQKYGCNHADGANLLARAVEPHGGIVIWRAFVYDSAVAVDRAKQASLEFEPLDGKFAGNACVQVKNGAIDFQPREPFHPLFGRMPKTPLLLELQITQEYLGQGTHWVFLGPLFEEVLQSDTFAKGPGSTVARVVDGSLHGHPITGIAGVSNIGNDRNWCGHPFAASNWYAFGKQCWDPELPSRSIARDFVSLAYSRHVETRDALTELMMASREACVDYMTPLGLHHIMAWDHHAGPGPWIDQGRPDWTSIYYHRADATGIGFDRTERGSNALEQYFPAASSRFATLEACPESLLLWFHHVPWDHPLKSGRTLWQELCHRYQRGVTQVEQMQATWQSLEPHVDPYRFLQVTEHLSIQLKEARFWRDSCTLYFQTFSGRPFPEPWPKAEHPLEFYRNFTRYYVPGIPERRFG